MSSLTPNGDNTITSGQSPTCVLVIDGIGVSANYTTSSGGYGAILAPGTYNLGGNPIYANTSIYVTVFNTNGTQTNFQCNFNVSTPVPDTYTPVLDYVAPTSAPKKVYTPTMFNTADGQYGFGLTPFVLDETSSVSDIPPYQLPYITGSNVAGASVPAAFNNTLFDQTLNVGATLTLTLKVTGTANFTYQWYKNGTTYGAAVGPTTDTTVILTETNRQLSDSGTTYKCKVTNAFNGAGVDSSTMTLTVASVAGFRPTTGTATTYFPNAVDTGTSTAIDNTTFTTKTSGYLTSTRYFTGFGTSVSTGTLSVRVSGTTEEDISLNELYTLSSSIAIAYSYNGGAYTDLVSADSGTSLSSTTPYTSPTLTNVDLSTLSVRVVLVGERIIDIENPDNNAVAISAVSLYDVVFLTTSIPVLTTNISGSSSVSVGNNLSLNVVASGSTPLTFTWYKNGVSFWVDPSPVGGTSSTLVETNRQLSDSGTTYYCQVSNSYGSTNSGTVTLTVGGSANHNRPTAWTGSGNTRYVGTLENAYDTSTNGVDTTTSTGYSDGQIIYTTFQGTGSISGTLNIRGRYVISPEGDVTGPDPAGSTYSVSTDGGVTWPTVGNFNTTTTTHTVSLLGVTLSQLRVKIDSFESAGGSIKVGTWYDQLGLVELWDIVIL